MKHIFVIGGGIAAPFLPLPLSRGVWGVLFCLLIVACTPSKPTPTDDTSAICAGRCGMVNGIQCGSCAYGYTCNAARYCVEITNDDIPAEDADTVADSPDDAVTDTDTPVGCPSLKYYANVKAAGFPLKDKDGKITFCRPGCDTPTENDPQCTRNLWEWVNWGRYQEYEQGKSDYVECYPWPCVLPGLRAREYTHECDKNITTNSYAVSMAALFDLKIQNGLVGTFMMGSSTDQYASHRMNTYDPVRDEFASVGYAFDGAFAYDRFIFVSGFENWTKEVGTLYALSAKKVLGGYKYETIYYDDEKTQFSRSPLIGEKWVVLNLLHRDTTLIEVVYAKVDEWNWRKLRRNKIYEGNIVDNRVTFIDDSRQVFVCDLDKLPFDPEKECLRIDRGGEMAYQPRLNEENKNQLVYFNAADDSNMTLVDLSGEKPAYSSLPFTISEPQSTGAYPHQFKGNLILYDEAFMPLDNSRLDYKACFYRIDKQKNYCPSKYTKPSTSRYDMGFNSFDGNYQLWKTPSGTIAAVRDIACYCEKEGACPFEGLKK